MISIIGTGRVGSAIAFLSAASSLDDLHLVNRTKEKALGQALDISNAIPSDSQISVIGTDFSEIKNSEVVVIAASTGTYTTKRTELLSEQANMIKNISIKIEKYAPDSTFLIISNPVDVLTYLFQKNTKIHPEKIIGVASSLDSSRFRYLLSKELKVPQSEIINALVLGEHGDSMVPVFSGTKWNEKPILDVLKPDQVHDITGNLIFYWRTLRAYKGPSIFGIAKNTFDIIKSIINHTEFSTTGAMLVNGEYGLTDACLGVPIHIDNQGQFEIQEISLTTNELDLLHKSSDTIKEYIKNCQ